MEHVDADYNVNGKKKNDSCTALGWSRLAWLVRLTKWLGWKTRTWAYTTWQRSNLSGLARVARLSRGKGRNLISLLDGVGWCGLKGQLEDQDRRHGDGRAAPEMMDGNTHGQQTTAMNRKRKLPTTHNWASLLRAGTILRENQKVTRESNPRSLWCLLSLAILSSQICTQYVVR